MPDKEVSAGNGSIVKTLYKRVLGRLVKIDHHVPAEDQVKGSAELDGIHQIECPEDHVLPDRRSQCALPICDTL